MRTLINEQINSILDDYMYYNRTTDNDNLDLQEYLLARIVVDLENNDDTDNYIKELELIKDNIKIRKTTSSKNEDLADMYELISNLYDKLSKVHQLKMMNAPKHIIDMLEKEVFEMEKTINMMKQFFKNKWGNGLER